jgi:alkane 1-monooxygenase
LNGFDFLDKFVFSQVFEYRFMKDAKYFIAYLLPLSAILSLGGEGLWAWATVILVFGMIPLLERVAPVSKENYAPETEDSRSKKPLFDGLLYVNGLFLFGIVIWYLFSTAYEMGTTLEWLGRTLSTGIVVGTCGINVAHELGHRNTAFDQNLSKILLLPALYQHFFIEHNRGHHKNVATDLDPASARKGEFVYAFWWRSIWGGWCSAWALERERLNKKGGSRWQWDNAMVRFSTYQFLWLAVVYSLFGLKALVGATAVALVGVLLLETVNYLEHYGLRRLRLPGGQYEPVSPRHSWNSNHEVGRILLYELTRHSDHHYKSTRKYQVLRHLDESPQLPFGYPTAVLICLVPPLWFAIMHKRLTHHL